jgi:hypothetical protein
MGALTKVRWPGPSGTQYVTERHLQHIIARERILAWLRYSTTIYQGSFNYGVKASAGTHDGADCIDCISNPTALRISRILGSARFKRTVSQGFSMGHDHEVLDYSGGAAPIAKNQLVSYHNRTNGLRGNGRDTDYRMMVFPKFIYNGYIGYVRAKKNTAAYEQQTKSSSKLNDIEIGLITLVVCETEVAGKRWYVTLTGKCILASEFSKVDYSFEKKAREYFIKKPAWRRKSPNSAAPKVGTRAMKVGESFAGAGRATVNKTVWITDKSGNSVPLSALTLTRPGGGSPAKGSPFVSPPAPAAPSPAPAPAPAPVVAKPVVPKSARLTIGTRNVIMRRVTTTGKNGAFTNVKRGLSWNKRLPLLATDVQGSGAAMLLTQEAGTYAAGHQLADAIGPAWKDILHGDDAGDITQGILWNDRLIEVLDEGKFHTEGTDHDWAVWTKNRIRETGAIFWTVSLHLEWEKAGKTGQGSQADHLRQAQFELAVKKMRKIAGPHAVIIWGGDLNSYAGQPYDGPGRAMKALDLVDCEVLAIKQTNTETDSYHGFAKPVPKNDRQYDRFAIEREHIESGKVIVHEYKVIVRSDTKAGSDHFMTIIDITIRTN